MLEMFTVRQAVTDLSEAHRTTLCCCTTSAAGRCEEVAAILEIPINTVRSRLMAAKRNLRAELPGFFPEAASPSKGKPMPTDTPADTFRPVRDHTSCSSTPRSPERAHFICPERHRSRGCRSTRVSG